MDRRIGGIERLADHRGEVLPGLASDRNLRSGNGKDFVWSHFQGENAEREFGNGSDRYSRRRPNSNSCRSLSVIFEWIWDKRTDYAQVAILGGSLKGLLPAKAMDELRSTH